MSGQNKAATIFGAAALLLGMLVMLRPDQDERDGVAGFHANGFTVVLKKAKGQTLFDSGPSPEHGLAWGMRIPSLNELDSTSARCLN